MMKIFVSLLVLTLGSLHMEAQVLDVNTFIDKQFYQQNISLTSQNDSIVLRKVATNHTFRIWHFKTNTLTISDGNFRENNVQAKCFQSVTHYRWIMYKEDDVDLLKISLGDTIRVYRIRSVSKNELVLYQIDSNIH